MTAARLLVVEDELAIRETLRDALELEGFLVETATDGARGLELARTARFDLVLLDWMLPGMPGLEVCQELRSESDVPIIMITARGQEIDRVRGLELGADDYIVKPFSLAEVVSRVRALLRRRALDRAAASPASLLSVSGITVDLVRHEASVDGSLVSLTPSELKLLVLFLREPGRTFTRAQIMEHLWESPFVGDARAADAHVSTLRRKIERESRFPSRIVTVRSMGYKLAG